MTKDEMIEALADYFGIDVPEKENGRYCWDYDWESGCSFGNLGPWLTLKNVVYALEDYCEDED